MGSIKLSHSLGPDPNVINELFEDWLAADRNWLASSCYLNAKRSREERKKGSWQMRDKTWLVAKYGDALATSIMASKWELQKTKPATDLTEYAMFDPEVPNNPDSQLSIYFLWTLVDMSNHKPL